MGEPNQNSHSDLIKIKINHLIKFSHAFEGIEVHVLINNKFIKMNNGNEAFTDILQKLQDRKLEEVYINPNDCKKVLTEIQNTVSSKSFNDPKKTDEGRMQMAEHSVEIIKSFINQAGITKECIDILNSVNANTLKMLQQSPSISQYIKKFKANNSEEFMKCILTSYLSTRMLDYFPWGNAAMKEKASIASLLCDLTLTKEELEKLHDYELNGTPLDEKIKAHPLQISRLLSQRKDVIPQEVLTIIEQHHEVPDGSGFPIGLDAHRISPLASIFIVAHKFIEYIVEENFDFKKRKEIMEKIHSNYHGKGFDKALSALLSTVH